MRDALHPRGQRGPRGGRRSSTQTLNVPTAGKFAVVHFSGNAKEKEDESDKSAWSDAAWMWEGASPSLVFIYHLCKKDVAEFMKDSPGHSQAL